LGPDVIPAAQSEALTNNPASLIRQKGQHKTMKNYGAVVTLCVVSCLFVASHEKAVAQENTAEKPPVNLVVHSEDEAAVSNKSDYRVHIRPVKNDNKDQYSPLASGSASLGAAVQNAVNNTGKAQTPDSETAKATTDPSIPEVPAPGFYPADLSNLGGAVVVTAETHNLYVDCAASCWGTPTTFQNNLYKSSFIHVSDQYIGSTANNRYSVGTGGVISYSILATLSDNDMLQIVHAAASVLGTGYHHIYNIFLPQGVDECFAGTTECYSPDNPATFVFCAYHASVTFSDIGHVLFTVEPYQNVPGCGMLQPSPNGALVDSTSSVLGHETFETITDPDGTAWIAVTSLGVFGEEIGDLCPGVSLTQPYFEDPVSVINGKKYEVQPMYSNKYHACSFAP
jgi:hypothetical protein